jgi:hypothetical protein
LLLLVGALMSPALTFGLEEIHMVLKEFFYLIKNVYVNFCLFFSLHLYPLPLGTQWGEGAGGGWFRLERGKNALNLESSVCAWATPAKEDVDRANKQYDASLGH